MLSDDLDEYVAQSTAAQVSRFNDMMKNLGIKLNPANVQPSVDANSENVTYRNKQEYQRIDCGAMHRHTAS